MKSVPCLGASELFAPHEKVWIDSRTVDSFCTIDWHFVDTTVISHKVVGGFVYQTRNPKFKNKVAIFIEETCSLKCGKTYTHVVSYYVKGDGVLETAWLRGECEDRCRNTPEGGVFDYRKMKRKRLTCADLRAIFNRSESWKTVLGNLA
jgi:hypothetical protein